VDRSRASLAVNERTKTFVGMFPSTSTNIAIFIVQNAEGRFFRDVLEDFSNTDDFWRVVDCNFICIDFFFHITLSHVFDDSITPRSASGSLWGRRRFIVDNSARSASFAFRIGSAPSKLDCLLLLLALIHNIRIVTLVRQISSQFV
jgi:hypothetical protein